MFWAQVMGEQLLILIQISDSMNKHPNDHHDNQHQKEHGLLHYLFD
jgi:hypothetical protein